MNIMTIRRLEWLVMRKLAGFGFACIAFGMFLALLVRDRVAIFFMIVILASAGYFCFFDP